MQQVIAKAWADEEFKQMLLADPAAALKQEGIAVPEGVQVKVVENTDNVFHLVLPPKQASDELSDQQLESAAGGYDSDVAGLFPKGYLRDKYRDWSQ
jgi:hypothetical protein